MPSHRLTCVSILALVSIALESPVVTAQPSFTEDFTTNTYKDAVNTTADWNTAAGELKLFPFAGITNVGSFDTPGNAAHVVVSGDLAFVADNPDVVIFDISDPTNPTVLGSFAGRAFGGRLSETALRRGFALLLACVGLFTLVRGGSQMLTA